MKVVTTLIALLMSANAYAGLTLSKHDDGWTGSDWIEFSVSSNAITGHVNFPYEVVSGKCHTYSQSGTMDEFHLVVKMTCVDKNFTITFAQQSATLPVTETAVNPYDIPVGSFFHMDFESYREPSTSTAPSTYEEPKKKVEKYRTLPSERRGH